VVLYPEQGLEQGIHFMKNNALFLYYNIAIHFQKYVHHPRIFNTSRKLLANTRALHHLLAA
jgi:hypothetical protein